MRPSQLLVTPSGHRGKLKADSEVTTCLPPLMKGPVYQQIDMTSTEEQVLTRRGQIVVVFMKFDMCTFAEDKRFFVYMF